MQEELRHYYLEVCGRDVSHREQALVEDWRVSFQHTLHTKQNSLTCLQAALLIQEVYPGFFSSLIPDHSLRIEQQ
jgi:hypothetical protein